MTDVRMRPTFTVDTDLSSAEVFERLRAAVKDSDDLYKGQFRKDHGIISIAESQRHFWSPWLHFETRSVETGIQVFGRFSPHPTIWTAFMFTYLALGVLLFFSLVVGLSQQLAGESLWGYYLVPIWIAIGAAMWFASQAGQKLALSEMRQVKSLVDECCQPSVGPPDES